MTTSALPEVIRISTLPGNPLQPSSDVGSGSLPRLCIEYADLTAEPDSPPTQPSQIWSRVLWLLADLNLGSENERQIDTGQSNSVTFVDAWEFTEPWPSHLKERLLISLEDNGGMNLVWPHDSNLPVHTNPNVAEPVALHNRLPTSFPAAETTQSSQVSPLLGRLADLYSTPENERWPDADWPTKAAFENAWEFTARLPLSLREFPHISLADDGEVNFAWSGGVVYIDLGFYGDGTFSYYGRDSDGTESFGDDIPVTSPLPEELVSLLTV